MNTVKYLFIFVLLGASWMPVNAGYILDLDHAAFRAEDSLGYVEIYAAVQRNNLVYESANDTLRAAFDVVLEVLQGGQSVLSDTFSAQDVRDTTELYGTPGQFFVHVFRFVMQPGTYGLRASLYQFGGDARDSVNDSLTVIPYLGDRLQVSDIELGMKLDFTKDEESTLVKNGVRLVPNPTGFFGTELPLFYYYAEAYGLDFDSAAVDSYSVTRRIIDAETNQPVRPDVVKDYPTLGQSVVIADGFPVTTLRTGTYLLELEVRSARTGNAVVARKKFWTYRKEDVASGRIVRPEPELSSRLQQVAPDFLDVVNVDSALHWMRYILTKEESNQALRLNEDGKRTFLLEYWEGREAEKPGAANQYFARVAEANRRYSFLKRPGWKTDRGRVFILYGEPDHVYQNYAVAGTPDHEVWDYEQLDGGVSFVFLDRTGFGDLDLVHSTKRGEIYNPDWDASAPARSRNDPMR